MRAKLQLHPDYRCDFVESFDVDVSRPKFDRLVLRYRIQGDIAALLLPPDAKANRADELWLHTCFEAFVRHGRGPSYLELNAAPSTQWASYRFSDYRGEMEIAKESEADRFKIVSKAYKAQLLRWKREKRSYSFEVSWLIPGLRDAWLNLSAVIEDQAHDKSYWAFAHPPGPPDFHHPDCFTLELPAPRRA